MTLVAGQQARLWAGKGVPRGEERGGGKFFGKDACPKRRNSNLVRVTVEKRRNDKAFFMQNIGAVYGNTL